MQQHRDDQGHGGGDEQTSAAQREADRGAFLFDPAPSSIRPITLDTQDDAYFDPGRDLRNATNKWTIADATARFLAVRIVPRRHKIIVAGAVTAALSIVIAAGFTTLLGETTGGQSAATSTAQDSKRTPHVVAASHVPRAAYEARSLAPTQGTITFARSNVRFLVDGKRAKSPSTLITCGPHMITVGWDRPRRVDVPCGGTVAADAPTK